MQMHAVTVSAAKPCLPAGAHPAICGLWGVFILKQLFIYLCMQFGSCIFPDHLDITAPSSIHGCCLDRDGEIVN